MEISIYTDGSSLGNPGAGGFAALLKTTRKEIIVKGGEAATTNNRMEMRAVIEAIKKIKNLKLNAEKIKIYSDSKLIIQTMNKGWKKKENIDLWKLLFELIETLETKGAIFEWHWIKGHAGHPENEICDKLAVEESEKIAKHAKQKNKKTAYSPSFFCNRCQKTVKGKLIKLQPQNLIRADCEFCGKFIKFAKHTPSALKRAKNPQKPLF